MKLNPEDLVVASFHTTTDGDAGAGAGGASPLCTILPTPCTVCLVCGD